MTEIRFDPTSYQKGAAGMNDAGSELAERTQALLAQVSDLSVLGTNDTLGGVCQMIYSVYLDVFNETVSGLIDGYADEGERLSAASQSYAAVEESNTQGASQIDTSGVL